LSLALPRSLEPALEAAAAELGWCSASRLFVSELVAAGGDELALRAADRLSRDYPIFACVADRFLAGHARRPVDPEPALAALSGIRRLVVVGLEADHLDALLPRLGDVEVGLAKIENGIPPDWRRVLANFDDRVRAVELSEVQHWAGRLSGLMTFVYGTDRFVAHVGPAWLRVSGPDVRTQFRTLVGWDVLGAAMTMYPRWLEPTQVADFSQLVPG
jgi:hypothetical protein